MTVACVGHHPDSQREAETGMLCLDCFSRLRSQLLELPAVATWLHVNLAAGGVAGERVSGSREDPMPLRGDVLDLIGPDSHNYVQSTSRGFRFVVWEDGDLLAECTSWRQAEARCREAMREAGISDRVIDVALGESITLKQLREDPSLAELVVDAQTVRQRWQIRPTDRGGWDQRGDDAINATLRHWCAVTITGGNGFDWTDWTDRNTLTGLVGWLTARLSWIAGQPWVGEFASEVRLMLSQAHRVAPWREEIRHDQAPCTSCGVRAVVVHIAAGESRCEKRLGGCERVRALSKYELDVLLPATRRAG